MMHNTKFMLLMMDLSQLIQGSSLLLDENHAVLCDYDGSSCRIENGVRVGLDNTLLVMFSMGEEPCKPETALRLNADFSLTADGYIALFKSECFFVRSIPLPEHPRVLLTCLSHTLEMVKTIKQDLKNHVVN